MFRQAVENVLKVEGGYTNHPDDRGGPTNFGITLQTLSQYRGTPVSDEDVRNLTRDEAIDIYYKFYWLPLGLDKVTKTKLAALIFDQGVNKGIYSAAKTIQKAVGVAADGKIGPMTLSAINACDETATCLRFFQEAQLEYVRIIKNNPSQIVFLEGWLRRTHSLLNDIFEAA